MAHILEPAGMDAPCDHLEIHCLSEGGYVVRDGRFNGNPFGHDDRFRITQERAAFTELADALKWIAKKMKNKSPTTK